MAESRRSPTVIVINVFYDFFLLDLLHIKYQEGAFTKSIVDTTVANLTLNTKTLLLSLHVQHLHAFSICQRSETFPLLNLIKSYYNKLLSHGKWQQKAVIYILLISGLDKVL